MAYIFNEDNFKNHLKNNASESWFSQSSSNIRYENANGIFNASTSSQYTVAVSSSLTDPSKNKTGEKVAEGVSATRAAVSGFLSAALMPIAPPASVAFGAIAAGEGGITKVADDARSNPDDVRFTLSADGGEWVAEQVNVNEVKEVAENIAKWSNEVYQEKFATQQAQVQQS